MARQQRGTVAAMTGEVAAGGIIVHRVPYGTDGSQNDVTIVYQGEPQIRVYATQTACVDFHEPPAANGTECAVLAMGSRSLTITHGRGNPERLGPTPEYKLWVVGDVNQGVRYDITISWFYGPDC
jgi:hypothetical protein